LSLWLRVVRLLRPLTITAWRGWRLKSRFALVLVLTRKTVLYAQLFKRLLGGLGAPGLHIPRYSAKASSSAAADYGKCFAWVTTNRKGLLFANPGIR
jgi:hypothetical protein